MANPTCNATLDKSVYADGSPMTLTVTYGDTDQDTGTVTVTVTDAAGNTSTPVTLPYSISDGVTLAVTDPERTWTKVSDTGTVAVYRATA